MRNPTSTSISDHWRTLSPYLDKALELEPAERSIWIRSQDPELANQLGLLLREHDELASEGFLENRTPELPPACSTLAGQTLGVYQLISQIGQGGMGSVWLAKRNDGRFERRVAIKFLNIAFIGKTGEERFRREGKILGLLGHENIAELIDAGVTRAGQPYLVLEYVDGEQIDHYCNHHRLDIRSRLTLFLDVLEAVAKAHANLIIHRDLKPSNILVRNDRLVKLLDFGIAKLVDTEDSPGAAAAFTIGGQALTPQYAAPEQLQGGQITTATDVYALGGLLYLLLTGQHSANRGQNTHAELLKAIIDSEPVRPSEIFSRTRAYRILSAAHAANASTSPEKLRRLLNGDLNTIVLKALKKGPAERYESVTAFADDLRRHLKNQPISACADTMTYRAFKFVRRNRTVVALAALAVFTTTAGLIGTLLQQRNVRIQRDLAVRQLARAERTADLNELLLSDVAPNGKPLTAGQLLLQEESVLQHEHNPDPINHVELLLSLGDQYSGADDNQSALRVLNHAYQLSRALRDSSIRAKASCVLAEALLPVGELARAEALFQQGLDEIADGSRSAATQAFCLVRGSEVAYRNGNSQQAIARARAAERMLQASSSHWNLQELNVLINLAGVLADAGKFREANQIFERASALITNLGYDSTQKAVKLFNDWALTLSYDGRQLQAERIYRRAIDISRTDETKNAVPPVLLFNYASLLRELGRSGEAAPYLQSAINKSRDANDKILVDQAELLQGRMYSDQGDYRRAEAIFKELEPRLRSKFPPNHYAFAALASERSRLSLETGDIKAALRFADQAVELDEGSIRNIGRCAAYLPILLIRRSRVEIAAQLYPQAEADAVSAMQLLNVQSESGVHSSNIGRAYLALSLALKSQGKSIDAQSASREALTNLQDTLGDRHPDTLAALDLAKRDSAIN